MEFIKGRDNLACTIFIPVDCGNNCKFCTTKAMYKDFKFTQTYVDRMVKWIDILNSNDMISEFVITGGEPTKDLEVLKKIVSACKKPVYINTSLPKQEDIFDVITYINQTPIIHGINISRHFGMTYDVPVYGAEFIDLIKKPVRINCVVNEKTLTIEKIETALKIYNRSNLVLNLRADYRTITDKNLKTRDTVFNLLFNTYLYKGSTSCLVCNSSYFTNDSNQTICYHRGVENSAVLAGNRMYINDVVINNKGYLFYDWTMENSPVNTEFISFLLSTDSKLIDGEITFTPDNAELVELETTDSSHLRKQKKIEIDITKTYSGCGYTPRKKKKKINTSCGVGTSVIGGCNSPGPITYQGCFVSGCGIRTYGYSGCGIRNGC